MLIDKIFDKATTLIVNCSNEYVLYLDTFLASLYKNSSSNRNYDVVVFETTISELNKEWLRHKYNKKNFLIRFFNPSSILNLNNLVKTQAYYSKESFYKLIVPKLFKNYKKVIYSDIDIIFNCDISEISDIDISYRPIAATRDLAFACLMDDNFQNYMKSSLGCKNKFDYFSAGLIVYNLDLITMQDVDNMLSLLHNNVFIMQEQDLLNKYFNGKIYSLPYKYCFNIILAKKNNIKQLSRNSIYFQEYKDAVKYPKVLHYSGSTKPWNNIPINKYDFLWWKYSSKFRILKKNIFFLKDKFKILFNITQRKDNLYKYKCINILGIKIKYKKKRKIKK